MAFGHLPPWITSNVEVVECQFIPNLKFPGVRELAPSGKENLEGEIL
jgi:hypothetical protein